MIAILSKGTASGINGAIVLCSMSAFGAVVQTNPVFSGVSGALMKLPLPPVFAYALLVGLLGILTGATVSGFQAGLGLALEHGKFGLTDAVLHRVGAASAATFNLAPFTGVVFVTLSLAGLSRPRARAPLHPSGATPAFWPGCGSCGRRPGSRSPACTRRF